MHVNTQQVLSLPVAQSPHSFANFRGQLESMAAVRKFATGGNATLTIRSRKSDKRFTYRISAPKDNRPGSTVAFFVGVLSGSDNERSYRYLGQIRTSGVYEHGQRSKVSAAAQSAQAFYWFWAAVQANANEAFKLLEVWHEGRCGRCGRKLTVPESIQSGFGPECIQHVH